MRSALRNSLKFVIQYKPARDDFLATMTAVEQAAVGAHFAYLSQLLDDGKLVFAGRRTDAAFGLAVFESASLEEAQATVANDPVVRAGVFTATCGEFSFALANSKLLKV